MRPETQAPAAPLVQTPVGAGTKRGPKSVVTTTLVVLLLAIGVGILSLAFTASKRDDATLVSGLPVHDGPANITAETLLNAGDLALIAGRIHEAAQHFERALTLAHKGGSEPLIAQAMAKLADAYLWQAKYERAADLGAESVRILEQSSPAMDPTQINPRIVLGEALIHLDKYAEAEIHLLRAIDLSQLLYGSSSPRTEGARSTLIKLRVAEGRLLEAEQLTRDLLAGPVQKGYHRLNHVLHQSLLGSILYDQQRYAEVINLAQEGLREVEALANADHPYAASMHQLLANAFLRTEQLQSAERHARESFRIWKLNQSDPQRSARAASTLGEVYVHQAKLNEAREQLTYAARILQDGSGHWHRYAKRENDERISLLNEAMAKQKS